MIKVVFIKGVVFTMNKQLFNLGSLLYCQLCHSLYMLVTNTVNFRVKLRAQLLVRQYFFFPIICHNFNSLYQIFNKSEEFSKRIQLITNSCRKFKCIETFSEQLQLVIYCNMNYCSLKRFCLPFSAVLSNLIGNLMLRMHTQSILKIDFLLLD